MKKVDLIPPDITYIQFLDTHTKEELLHIIQTFSTYLQSGIPDIRDKNQTDRVIRLTHPAVFGKLLVFRNEKIKAEDGTTTHLKKASIFNHDLSYIRAQ